MEPQTPPDDGPVTHGPAESRTFAPYARDMTASHPVLRELDAVTVPVPDLDSGLAYYRDKLGHALLWRNDDVGQAGLALPDGNAELVLATRLHLEPNWLVDSVDDAVAAMVEAGGTLVAEPAPIPVGRVAVVADPFENPFVLVEIVNRYPTVRTGGNGTQAS